jgi:Flp pilus assembly protein TadB
MIRVVFLLLVFFIVITVASYTTALSESAKLFLLGGILVGIAVWGRRKLRRQENS